MKNFKKVFLPILIVGIWINFSETIRWIFLIESYWLEHYETLGIVLPNALVNMIIWMFWGFIYATIIFFLSKKFSVIHTTFLVWVPAFFMMWLVVYNVGVLSTKMLWFNVPLSIIETFIGTWICAVLIKKWH